VEDIDRNGVVVERVAGINSHLAGKTIAPGSLSFDQFGIMQRSSQLADRAMD
jgi:hypothetical protein